MLVRGVLGRLTADVTKASSHDLSQLVRYATAPNRVAPFQALCVTNRTVKLARSYLWRSYATKSASKAGRAGTKTKKVAPKKRASKKTSTKSKAAPKKKVVPKKRELSEKGKERKAREEMNKKIKDLKAQALLEGPKMKVVGPFVLYSMEKREKGVGGRKLIESMSETASGWRNLSAADKELYLNIANGNKKANAVTYKNWVESHTPEQIRQANIARRSLRMLLSAKTGERKFSPSNIKDERQVLRRQSSYAFFIVDAHNSGEAKGLPFPEIGKLLAKRFKELSAAERKKYDDLSERDGERYNREFEAVYGHPPPSKA